MEYLIQWIIFIILPVLGFFTWSILSARKKFLKSGLVLSRLGFAYHTLVRALTLVFGITILLFLFGDEGVVYAAPFIAIAALIFGIFTFIVSLILYGSFIKRLYNKTGMNLPSPVSLNASKWRQYGVAIVIVTLVTIFLLLGGNSARETVLGFFANVTNSEWLVEFQRFDFQKDRLFLDIARDTNDPSVCDKISTEIRRGECYAQADPYYVQPEQIDPNALPDQDF